MTRRGSGRSLKPGRGHPVPVVPDNDLLGTVETTDGDRCLDVHRLRVEGVPDQLGNDADRARAFHVPQDRVPATARTCLVSTATAYGRAGGPPGI